MAINSFSLNIAFAQLIDGNFTIIGRGLYSPHLKDAAALKDAKVIFNFSHSYLLFIFPRIASARPSTQSNLQTNATELLLAELHPSNLVNTIFVLVFYRRDSQIAKTPIFVKRSSAIGFPYKHCNF